MRFRQFVFGIFVGVSLISGGQSVLQKTEEEALKFLVDNGHITSDSTAESFSIDRDGNIRIRVLSQGQVLSYGLQESEDTYQITYMQRKKAPKPKISTQNNEQISALLAQKMQILKGGQVTSVTQQSGSKKRKGGNLMISYAINKKQYEIQAYYDERRGEISIKSMKEKPMPTKAEL